ncbi:MAG: glutamine amidotransferase [Gemmatimonadota bacterium]
MEGLFQFLFKYRPILFREGDVVFATPWPMGVVVGLVAVLGIAAVVSYGGAKGKASPAERTLLGSLRLAALGVLTFALLQPTLVLDSDDSRSMNLPDVDGAPRRDWVTETFGTGESEVVEALAERFALRFFRFSSETGRVESADGLSFDGTRTDLARALDRARGELSSVPLSGLVVVSDGAENGGTPLAEALVPLQASAVPVYTVGVGAEALTPDVQVSRVEAPRSVLKGTGTLVDVVLDHRGLGGQRVELLVEDGSRILARQEVELGSDTEPTLVRLPLTLDEAGTRLIRFRVPVLEGEAVPENNARERVIGVTDRREKVLYFEGEPRDEVGFLRRAVDGDENLQVVVLQRTAQDKFLRLDVDGPDELLGGFPRTREELFRYRGMILGSVEASFFTRDQLEMLADFVGERGGGLLFLGGRNAFAEGGFAGTAVEDVLPVYLEERAPDPRAAFTEVSVRPTPAGLDHPIGQLGEEGWDDLPPLSSLNRILRVKPGATTLLAGESAEGEERVVLAYHRYGRGKALALPVQDTWMWQMHADIPVEDQRHETLWRQLLRWLVDDVPEPVSVSLEPEQAEAGESVALAATVFDSAYIGMNNARVSAVVTTPSGGTLERPLTWAVDRDGAYAGTFVPPEDGTYAVRVEARTEDGVMGIAESVLEVGPSREEYFNAGRRTAVLERIARETGGRSYTRDDVDRLPEDVRFTGAGVTVTERRELWDMPVIFLLLVGLLAAEWGVRRMKGFA